LHHLTAAAATELGARGIRVVAVAPGLVAREGLEEAWPEGVERYRRASALGRPVTAREVAETIAFLASPAASGITGTTITIDAGWSATAGW
jgi:3-oxoacyl-[acyl-carrier protein] reductase